MTKELSKYQVRIDQEYMNTMNNIVVEAGPGSGKSFTIKYLLGKTPKFLRTILVAFNKSIQEELASQVPENIEVRTVHSLSYSILRKNVKRNFKVNNFKTYIIAKKKLDLKHLKENKKDPYLFTISDIVGLARFNLCKTKEEIETICDEYNISIMNGEVEDTMKVMEALEKYNKGDHREFMIDFTDMLWLAYKMVKPEQYPQYNVLFIDEAQDINPLQMALIDRCISRTNGRFVAVGDEKQSIYSFMGANTKSIRAMKERPRTTVLPLSVTYRCPTKVVDLANTIFDGLEAFEKNPEGVIRNGNLNEAKDGDFVICRNNLPLVQAWIQLIAAGKKCHILGKDFGVQLVNVIYKVQELNIPLKEAKEKMLFEKEEQLKERGFSNPKKSPAYQSLFEKLTIIEILERQFGDFNYLVKKVGEIFNDDENKGVTLCTGHKSKGLEADRVFFLNRELIPSKYAQTELEIWAERCLKYVIVTRSRKELIYVNI